MREQAKATADQAKTSASEVAGTAQEQVKHVASEASRQVRHVASDVRDRLGQEAQEQSGRAADMLAKWADELGEMAGSGDTPARAVARQLSDKGHEFADQLRQGGPDDLLDQVRGFARRRPGAFLLGSAAAGFLIGRIGKGLAGSGESTPDVEERVERQPSAESVNPAYGRIPDQPGPVPTMPAHQTADPSRGPVRR
ncbi:hypothetical protein [Actinokineospora sp. UTMC 2448]|uniref:hypothetical protein n=1 Tax=Actinokineospora sp. UTMC 2448 TaxID=2268449 RepID=UPI002164BCE3|nr:hypothetical protein [Actinokineospora sp. UTMC 2448]UVS79636.1 hypothetical protein Actkin_03386 [Actinokineospora sp. UTMC 2448]